MTIARNLCADHFKAGRTRLEVTTEDMGRHDDATEGNRRLAAGITGVILVGASGTMAIAAQSALPGDRLYPLKRGLEGAHAQLTFDRAARGRVLLDSASTRLDEVADLSRRAVAPTR